MAAPPSLRESLALSRTARASELRRRTYDWAEMLRSGNVAVHDDIRREVEDARNGLAAVQEYRSFGDFMTFVGVTAFAATELTGIYNNFPGLSAMVVGVWSSVMANVKASLNKWAMFQDVRPRDQ